MNDDWLKPFPSRDGTPMGGSLERTMLNKVGGPNTIRTEIQVNPDGSTTMLRTRNGMPEFTTTVVSTVDYVEPVYAARTYTVNGVEITPTMPRYMLYAKLAASFVISPDTLGLLWAVPSGYDIKYSNTGVIKFSLRTALYEFRKNSATTQVVGVTVTQRTTDVFVDLGGLFAARIRPGNIVSGRIGGKMSKVRLAAPTQPASLSTADSVSLLGQAWRGFAFFPTGANYGVGSAEFVDSSRTFQCPVLSTNATSRAIFPFSSSITEAGKQYTETPDEIAAGAKWFGYTFQHVFLATSANAPTGFAGGVTLYANEWLISTPEGVGKAAAYFSNATASTATLTVYVYPIEGGAPVTSRTCTFSVYQYSRIFANGSIRVAPNIDGTRVVFWQYNFLVDLTFGSGAGLSLSLDYGVANTSSLVAPGHMVDTYNLRVIDIDIDARTEVVLTGSIVHHWGWATSGGTTVVVVGSNTQTYAQSDRGDTMVKATVVPHGVVVDRTYQPSPRYTMITPHTTTTLGSIDDGKSLYNPITRSMLTYTGPSPGADQTLMYV